MKKFFSILFVLAITGVLYYAFLGSFRYKNYLYSDYVFMLKENGKVYKMDPVQLVGDRITGKRYVLLGLSKSWSYGHEIQKIFMFAGSDYKINNTDSRFYDGILTPDYSKENPVKITEIKKEINIHKSEEVEILDINYNGRNETMTLEPNNKNPEFKAFSFWICSKRRNGYSCGNRRGYGIDFEKLKNKFGLNLDIEINNREKVVYFIKK